MIIKKQQVDTLIKNGQERGLTGRMVIDGLIEKGFEPEGLNIAEYKQFNTQAETIKKKPITSSATFKATGDESLMGGVTKAIGNIPSSGIEMGKNIIKAVTHPVETLKSVGGLVKGAGAKLGETLLEKTDIGQSLLEKANQTRIEQGLPELNRNEEGKLQTEDTPELEAVNKVGNFFAERYGSLENFKKTAIEDPVGVLADVATIFTGGASVIGKVGQVAKIGEVGEVASTLSKVGQTLEPISAISKTFKATKNLAKETTPGKIVSEIIPTGTDIQRSQVVKALDLTQGDLSNISKSTGNDVTDFIVKKNLIKGTPEEVADSLNSLRKTTKETRNTEIGKVTNIYTPDQVPFIKQGLSVIEEGVKDIPGLEQISTKIQTLANKDKFTLQDIQMAKDLLDENSNIYSKIGDVKSSATARGLDNIRKQMRKFIEDEVTTATNGAVDIKGLNNDIATSYAIEDAINTRATRNLTRQKISLSDSVVLFGGGAAINPVAGIGLYIGKKLIETPSFRLAFTKALSGQSAQSVRKIITEVKNKNVTPATQKLLNKLADEARKNLQVIESGSATLEKSKEQ